MNDTAAEKRARGIIRSTLLTLERNPDFKLWMGRLLQRCGLTDDLRSSEASDTYRFLGRRSVAVETLKEIEDVAPGFYERVLSVRRAFEAELSSDKIEDTGEPDAD